MSLLLPLLLVDAIAGWMFWTSWRGRELMGVRPIGRQDRAVYWFGLARLGAVLVLALIGTAAAVAALD